MGLPGSYGVNLITRLSNKLIILDECLYYHGNGASLSP
jgi:hypothetical protein